MNKNDKITINEVRYREEDFGILLQSHYGGMHVVNETGIALIEEIKNSREKDVDNLIKTYLSRFTFDSSSEFEQAYNACIDYLTNLNKLKIIKVCEE